jgi:NhaP-type Na+/H+ or K+/H+ antiporter
MRFAQERNFVDHDSYIVLYVSLALFTVGAASSLGNDDLLAAFAAGLFIVYDDAVGAYPCV